MPARKTRETYASIWLKRMLYDRGGIGLRGLGRRITLLQQDRDPSAPVTDGADIVNCLAGRKKWGDSIFEVAEVLMLDVALIRRHLQRTRPATDAEIRELMPAGMRVAYEDAERIDKHYAVTRRKRPAPKLKTAGRR